MTLQLLGIEPAASLSHLRGPQLETAKVVPDLRRVADLHHVSNIAEHIRENNFGIRTKAEVITFADLKFEKPTGIERFRIP